MNYYQAQEKVQSLKKFYKNLLWFGIVAAIIYGRDIFRHGKIDVSLFHGSFILTIWAIILIVKAVKLFVLNSAWESKMIQDEMKKSKDPIQF
ncbi:2TM domain-containing protein [Chryseobacterium sp.]|uniref:2TM domain-containing protein n=1 Tax=Chryseobacterium sp. TaxID=1871047 RepID=UPI0028965F6D|nr:2TM domain-containing protein [Chryseobacterium sp.]